MGAVKALYTQWQIHMERMENMCVVCGEPTPGRISAGCDKCKLWWAGETNEFQPLIDLVEECVRNE